MDNKNMETQEALPQTIRVRYNHEDIDMPYADAVSYIQKGMNYDKVMGQLSELKNDEALRMIDRVAAEFGVTRTDMVKKFISDLEEQRALEFAREKGLSMDMAMEVLQARKISQGSENDAQMEAAQAAMLELLAAQEEDFRAAYPDIADDDVPDEVLMDWSRGVPLKHAYQSYENPILKEKLKSLEEKQKIGDVNGQNAAMSMGPVRSSGDTQPVEITAESVKQMTSAQRKKYMSEILDAIRQGKLRA